MICSTTNFYALMAELSRDNKDIMTYEDWNTIWPWTDKTKVLMSGWRESSGIKALIMNTAKKDLIADNHIWSPEHFLRWPWRVEPETVSTAMCSQKNPYKGGEKKNIALVLCKDST